MVAERVIMMASMDGTTIPAQLFPAAVAVVKMLAPASC